MYIYMTKQITRYCLGPEVIKLFSCSTQLSNGFQLLIKSKMLKNKSVLPFKLSDVVHVLIMLIYVKMPTIVGISTFMSTIHFMFLNQLS